ncbi:MAG: hypothetical protein K2I89_01740 [Muribaculaceae bacterium]|nr:hypothetical protein [Muribaculaceae bacterium]
MSNLTKIKSVLMRFAVTITVGVAICAQSNAQTRNHMPTRKGTPAVEVTDSAALAALPDSIPTGAPVLERAAVIEDRLTVSGDSVTLQAVDTVEVKAISKYDVWIPRETEFNPDPTRAVWMSALFPGLGQIYNRRYWKLPIVVGAYLGLGYATSWNNGMLNDYTRAYRDIMDTDPATKSYMDFFPPTIKEEDLDKTWLTNVLRSRKNFYRRNRDLCVICMIGVYLVAMVDAYVDASLSHFDITPDLSMDVSPAVFLDGRNAKPSVGLMWALTF